MPVNRIATADVTDTSCRSGPPDGGPRATARRKPSAVSSAAGSRGQGLVEERIEPTGVVEQRAEDGIMPLRG